MTTNAAGHRLLLMITGNIVLVDAAIGTLYIIKATCTMGVTGLGTVAIMITKR